MIKIKKTTALLLLIFAIGIILRFYRLGDIPVGFQRDEAFLGYNAYALLQTGRDMNGNFLPLHLKSFLYSPAGYSYFSIPFVALFDLNSFSVRFASAFFGSFTIIALYFLVRELFANKKYVTHISLLAAGVLTFSPWHISLSRTATENVLVVFFILLGIIFHLFWVKKGKWWLCVSSFIFFALTIFLYQASRAFLPFFLPLLIFFFPPPSHRKEKYIAWIIGFFVVIILPLLFILFSKDLNLRIKTVSIFATEESKLVLNDHILTDGVFNIPVLQTRLFHNKPIIYAQAFLENYFSHFSYQFLFSDKGFPERYKIPRVGLLYIVELPFLLVGLLQLIKVHKKIALFLLGWLMITPIGSGLTFDDVPNLQRTLMLVPIFSIFTTYGVICCIMSLRSRLRNVAFFAVAGVFVYSVSFYLHQYYVHSQVYRPWYRQDGYKELVSLVNTLLPKYEKAVITDRESAPTIFFLFYGKYSPSLFQKETQKSTMRDFDRISFSRYEFSQEQCPLTTRIPKKEVIYVNSGLCTHIPGAKHYTEIKRQDDSVAFLIYTIE